jgi:hypothetical protein
VKHLSEEAIEYINNIWGLDSADSADDIKAFWDESCFELVALRLVDAGAVEPNCKEAQEMIKVAESIDFKTQRKLIDKALDGYSVQSCKQCNAVSFFRPTEEPEHCYSCLARLTGPIEVWNEIGKKKRGAK